MPTYPARNLGYQTIGYLRAPITFGLGYTGTKQVGTLPAGCVVLRSYIVVKTAFNNGSTNTMTIGTVASPASFGTGIALGTVGVITGGTALATSATVTPTVDTPVVAVMASTGSAATTGAGEVVVEYLPER